MNALALGRPSQTFTVEYSDNALLTSLVAGDEKAFEQVFKEHFKNLHRYACAIVKDEDTGEEMVQQVFYKIWKNKSALNVQTTLKAYLYRAVHNECLNHLKHNKVKAGYQMHAAHVMKSEEGTGAANKIAHGELQKKLQQAMNELPEQCRTIFQLSRFEELKYKEIADLLGLSIKTVENQMGKALKLLRLKLVDFLPLILFIHCMF